MIISENIPASVFSLPTNGAMICSVELNSEKIGTAKFYRVLGKILSVDKSTPEINFEINLPLCWNGKMVHFGGGGFNGYLVSGLGHVPCEGENKPTALSRGYVTCGSDSGHKNTSLWDASWALNDECLENFGYAHIKKVKDVVDFVIKEFYGHSSSMSLFVGSSNGGREALIAAQKYYDDYDGVLVGYPVFNWTPKILTDYRNMQIMDCAGSSGFISADDFMKAYIKIQRLFEKYGYMKDGLVEYLQGCESLKEEAFSVMGEVLRRQQIETLRCFYEDMNFEYELANGVSHMHGFSIVQQFCDHKFHPFGKIPCARDGIFAKTVDAIIRYQILRDEKAPIDKFDYRKHKNEVLRLSNIMDATDSKLDGFSQKGGKVLMIHGTSDQLLSLYSTIDYYQQVVKHLGNEKSNNFIKLFLVPGYGHDYGEVFNMHADVLQLLDDWVRNGIAPDEIVAEDQNINNLGRIKIIKAFK